MRHDKPTHKSIRSLLEFMKSKKDARWIASDDPGNDPKLVGFTDTSNSDGVYCSIESSIAFKYPEWQSANYRKNLAKGINSDTKFCKDCRHVDQETLARVKNLGDESVVLCKRPVAPNPVSVSSVTGIKMQHVSTLYCLYERSLGGCQSAQFFEPRK